MTPEAQRIAIAEACGWKWKRTTEDGRVILRITPAVGKIVIINPQKLTDEEILFRFIPNYLSDLNAMHEAEKVLEGQAKNFSSNPADCPHWLFMYWLAVVVGEKTFDNGEWVGTHNATLYRLAHATAVQRAEAFLRTLNLWK